MSWLKEVFDGFRGKVNEVGQAVADDPAVAIPAMEQKIRDAESDLAKSKNALTDVMAQERLAGQKVADLKSQIEEYEGYAVKAADQGDENLVGDLVEKITETESELGEQEALHETLVANVAGLKDSISKTEKAIKSMKTEVKTIKATEYAQQAALEVSAKHSGASSSTARAAERMQRIKERQQHRKAKMDAAEQLSRESGGDALKERLAAAGIGAKSSSRDDVMARIKAKQQSR